MTRKTRPISWIKSALKECEAFPEGARLICLAALTIAAEGGQADLAKTMLGFGSGVFEIALPFRGDAFRACTPYRLLRRSGFMRSKREGVARRRRAKLT